MRFNQIGCVVCGTWEFEKHHLKTRKSGGSDRETNLFELCRSHHTEIHTLGTNRFAMKYERFKKELIRKGWEFDLTLLRWTHVLERSIIE